MSSLRNSLHRRNHKERSQLSHRAKFGILEKHKDYVLRAKDYHSKQDRIRRLKQKAADRNKDEFYFGMTGKRTQEGVHIKDRGNVAMPLDIVKVLKTQDENYIRTMRSLGQKKIDKLKSQLTSLVDLIAPSLLNSVENSLGGLDEEEIRTLKKAGIFKGGEGSSKGTRRIHMIFVDNEEEAKKYISSSSLPEPRHIVPSINETDVDEHIDLGWKVPELNKHNRKGKAPQTREDEEKLVTAERIEEAKKHRTRLLKELSARLERDTQLRYAQRELEMQRLLMGKGGSQKVRGVELVGGNDNEDEDEEDFDIKKERKEGTTSGKVYKPRVYKWRAERKR